MSNNKIRFINF